MGSCEGATLRSVPTGAPIAPEPRACVCRTMASRWLFISTPSRRRQHGAREVRGSCHHGRGHRLRARRAALRRAQRHRLQEGRRCGPLRRLVRQHDRHHVGARAGLRPLSPPVALTATALAATTLAASATDTAAGHRARRHRHRHRRHRRHRQHRREHLPRTPSAPPAQCAPPHGR